MPNITDFWLSETDKHPLLSDKSEEILIPFPTSYLCEAGFLAVTGMHYDSEV